jgi:hypothetical protein
MSRTGPAVLSIVLTAFSAGIAEETLRPEIISAGPTTRPVQFSDGSLHAYFSRFGKLFSMSSKNGREWSKPDAEFDLPFKSMGGGLSLVDSQGEVHVILTHARGTGRQPAVTRFIDLWHCRTFEGRRRWGKPQRIWEGYCGAVMDFQQLKNGRLVVPFAAWKKPGETVAAETGSNYTTVVTSSDSGKTWKLSATKLTSPCRGGYNGNNYGAIEPTILQLKDARVWMLMRTQTGFLYESFSKDGVIWSPARASRFHSSTSPAALVRLSDGRIVVVWNNCEQPPKYDMAGVYGGRDVLHAAISADEGKTWRGFREIYRDPHRNETPPKRGDRGTAYPVAVATRDGKLLVVSGQGGRRTLIRLDPDWLMQTKQVESFESGLSRWHVWKPFGPARGYWRDRTPGPVLVAHPTRKMAKVLHIRKPDQKAPDCATWNFPASNKGEITLRLLAKNGSGGVSLAFNNRFFNPVDNRGEQESAFVIRMASDGTPGKAIRLNPDRWHTLVVKWDLEKKRSLVVLNEKVVARRPIEIVPFGGVSYLRIRSTATDTDTAGVLIESVRADVEHP